MAKGLVHVLNSWGHRGSYRDLFAALLDFSPTTGPLDRAMFRRLLGADRLLLATIDGHIDKYLILAFLRALLFRPTCAIFIYPARCFEKKRLGDYTIRKWLLAVSRIVPNLTVLSIIPYDLRPEFRSVTSNWIHDPQLWDLWAEGESPDIPTTSLSQRISLASEKRDVLVFLGQMRLSKGFRDLVEFAENKCSSLLVAACGQIEEECREDVERLKACGGIVEDRFIADDELLSLYGIATFIWCRYSEGRQASSGIFGRAVQTGLMPIIFEDSYIGEYARANDLPYAVISDNELHRKIPDKRCEIAGNSAASTGAKRGRFHEQAARAIDIVSDALRVPSD